MSDKNKNITERLIEDVEVNGEKKNFYIVKPKHAQHIEAQIEHNKAVKKAVDSGAYLRKELYDRLEKSGVWGEEQVKKQEQILHKISALEDKIRSGGLRVSELKQAGIDIKKLRAELRFLIAEKNAEDLLTAESQAENIRFLSYASSCILDENRNRLWKNLEEYTEVADESWVLKLTEQLAELIYGLEEDYEDKYVENRFLKRYGIVNENYHFIQDGHLVDEEGRRVNEEGYYIDEQGNRVNKDGRPVDENGDYLDAAPMLDDDGNPIILSEDEETAEKVRQIKKDEEEKVNENPDKKKRGKPSKKETAENA